MTLISEATFLQFLNFEATIFTQPLCHNHSQTSWVLSGFYYVTKMILWSLLLRMIYICLERCQQTPIFPPESKLKVTAKRKQAYRLTKRDSKHTISGTISPNCKLLMHLVSAHQVVAPHPHQQSSKQKSCFLIISSLIFLACIPF